jgi:hypothetical protein
MRSLLCCVAFFLVAGCAVPAIVQNPKTGETVTCSTPSSEWDPWSQSDACVAGRLAQGWVIVR